MHLVKAERTPVFTCSISNGNGIGTHCHYGPLMCIDRLLNFNMISISVGVLRTLYGYRMMRKSGWRGLTNINCGGAVQS